MTGRQRVAVLVLALLACAWGATGARAAEAPEIRVLSNRADLVSGGDALVEIVPPDGVEPQAARIDVAGRDVTNAFALRPNGRFQGVVRGLPVGHSAITVRLRDGRGAQLTIDNHPSSGPVFAGPQVQPWICLDGCSPPTRHDFYYRSTNPVLRGFRPYNPASPPADVARTTTDQGEEVPFVVRVETGVMNRGVYAVAVLFDPRRPWAPWAPQPGWNGKLIWPFGGDCKPWHRQDVPPSVLGEYPLDPDTGGVVNVGVDEALGGIFGNANAAYGLSRGFAVASSGNNKLGSQCNTVVSAESVMMLKERIAETYGPIRYTIGSGGSGGAMQQHQIASAYPGLLDGIQPVASFPDIWEVVQEAEDCHLLNHYFDVVSPQLWPVLPQRDAVAGTMGPAGCRLQFDGPQLGTPVVGNYAGTWLDPANELGCGLPAEQVYDARTNPSGVRCTLPDYMVSVFGRRPSDGFANRPYDNLGVQYGLRALESGAITAEQFVDLNENIGGLDIDWNFQPGRSAADPAALRVAYRAGLVSDGRRLAEVPIVDIRGQDNYEIHADFHSYAMRARLDRANGHHDNQVIFTGFRPQAGDPTSYAAAFALVDEWLERVEADRSRRGLAEKVRRNRPPRAVDTCWFEGRPVTDAAVCRALFPYFGDPRIAAGGPLADDVLKCRLKPLDADSYPVRFSDQQLARLRAAFPSGVCDYTRPGAGQVPAIPWMTFAEGPGGGPLGPPPRSAPLPARRALTPSPSQITTR